MARDRDIQDDRFFEGLFYGTPSYALSRTPDGRIVSELSKGRKEEGRRHEELMAVQEGLANALTKVRDDRPVNVEVMMPPPVFDQGITRAIGGLGVGVQNLVEEAQLLRRLTENGFGDVGREVHQVGDAVRGVGVGIERLDRNVSHFKRLVIDHARAAQGPQPTPRTIEDLTIDSERLVQTLGAYQSGVLNERGRRELEGFIRERLFSQNTATQIRQMVSSLSEPKQRIAAQGLTWLADDPSQLLVLETRNEATIELGRLEKLAGHNNNPELTEFVLNLIGLLNLCEMAGGVPVDENFLIQLTNNGLVTDAVSYDVKRKHRGARMEGSAVDRNFNLLELLSQGDRAEVQRGQAVNELRKQTTLSATTVVGQTVLIDQGNRREQQLRELLRTIERAEVNTTGGLSAIRDASVATALAVGKGFDDLGGRVDAGFAGEIQSIDSLRKEVQISRREIVGQLSIMNSTIVEVGAGIRGAIEYANSRLDRGIELAEKSLTHEAKQRMQQGLKLLETAETEADLREVEVIFLKGIELDPSFVPNQYGAALTAEALKKCEEAFARYRNVGRLKKGKIAAIAWVKCAEIKLEQKEATTAIEFAAKALNEEPNNAAAQMIRVKALSATRAVNEAAGYLFEMVQKCPSLILRLAKEGIEENVQTTVYERMAEVLGKGTFSKEVMRVVFRDLLASQAQSKTVIKIVHFYMEFDPEFFLLEEVDTYPEYIVNAFRDFFVKNSNKELPYTAKAYYAVALLCLRTNLQPMYVENYFEKGLKHDLDYQTGDMKAVVEKLRRMDGKRFKCLTTYWKK